MTTIAQRRVPNTRTMSIPARRLFLNPNCSGVKEKLKIRLSKKGSTTIKGIFLCANITKTFPKEIAIRK